MSERPAQDNRSESSIIEDLERLSQEDGFIYTFCHLVLRALWMSLDEIADIDWKQRLNVQELSLLLGLMVKHPLSLALVPSEETAHKQAEVASGLLEELHRAQLFSTSAAAESHQNAHEWVAEVGRYYDDWMASGRGMVEPIFYGDDGAYDFQYLEMAKKRYRNDEPWIQERLGTSWESVLEVAEQLKGLAQTRAGRIDPTSTFQEISSQCLAALSFTPEDISNVNQDAVESFIEAFALAPGEVNLEFHAVGAYNAVHSHPIIRLEGGMFFLPVFFNLAKSIYESPYYWMLKDSKYRETGLSNRGDATEEIAFELLTRVFGKENVRRGVKIRKLHQDTTDIDVLAVAGNKAVIVQAKSKKLTMMSRSGDRESLKGDFQEAVQDAYEQALLSRRAVLEAGNSLTAGGERLGPLNETIDDAYLICLTGDHYPAVTTQVESYLRKEEGDPYPLAMSIFDLDILAFYLQDPFDLLYYLRQRSTLAAHFKSDSEMALLAFHLRNKLYPTEEADLTYIDQGMAGLIDANFPVARGHYPKTKAADRLFHQWRNEDFESLVNQVKMMDQPGLTDVLFFLFDLAGSGADNLIRIIQRTKRATSLDGELHDATIPFPRHARGITFVSYPRTSSSFEEQRYQDQFRGLAMSRKYKSGANEWLALASRSDDQGPFNLLWYSKEPWQHDQDLEHLAKVLLKPGRAIHASGRKLGRNERCPCGSGLKFKRCHGRCSSIGGVRWRRRPMRS